MDLSIGFPLWREDTELQYRCKAWKTVSKCSLVLHNIWSWLHQQFFQFFLFFNSSNQSYHVWRVEIICNNFEGKIISKIGNVFSNSTFSCLQLEMISVTLFQIFIFCPKIQLWYPEKNCPIVLGETRENAAVLEFLSCWQLWFHEKNCQKNLGWKTRENVGDLHFLVVDNFDFPRKL